MRAGQLRHVITVQRMVSGLDEFGGATETWGDLASLRAGLGPIEAVEKQGADGAQDLVTVVFNCRIFGSGLTVADRVMWRGLPYAIKRVVGGDFAQGDGMQLHCEGRL